jgi:hypothetical protein
MMVVLLRLAPPCCHRLLLLLLRLAPRCRHHHLLLLAGRLRR